MNRDLKETAITAAFDVAADVLEMVEGQYCAATGEEELVLSKETRALIEEEIGDALAEIFNRCLPDEAEEQS